MDGASIWMIRSHWRNVRAQVAKDPTLPEAKYTEILNYDRRAETSKQNILAAWRSNKKREEAKQKLDVKKEVKKTHVLSKGEALLQILGGNKKKQKKKKRLKDKREGANDILEDDSSVFEM